MPDYRRAWLPGGTYFFTVNLLRRRGNDLLTRHVDVLRAVVIDVRRRHPFVIHAWVVLPDHLHCIIEALIFQFVGWFGRSETDHVLGMQDANPISWPAAPVRPVAL